MHPRPKARLALLVLPLLLAACGTSAGVSAQGGTAPATTASPTSGMVMPDGMTMAPGETMAGESTPGPPETASMVCGEEIQGSIKTLLALPALPKGTSTWQDGLFTCTYPLAQGRLVLSVQVSADATAAKAYFNALRARSAKSTALTGLTSLGLPAFQSASGVVSFVKDNMTLEVDASGLTPLVGPHQTTGGDFAYTVATDVLACWQE